MAKYRKKRQPVYHNNGSDNWTNDTKEQLSLIPGSDGYEARQSKLAESSPMSDENMNKAIQKQSEVDKKVQYESKQLADDFHDAFVEGQKSASMIQYRAMASRQDAVKQTAKIASEGLGRNVSEKEIEQAASGISVKPEDVPKVLKNYEKELHEREIPKIDTNGDGKIDEDDAYMTPGMSRMRRYM